MQSFANFRMASETSETALDMRVTKAGHDEIPLARIERKARQSIEEESSAAAVVLEACCSSNGNGNGNGNVERSKIIKCYYSYQTGF